MRPDGGDNLGETRHWHRQDHHRTLGRFLQTCADDANSVEGRQWQEGIMGAQWQVGREVLGDEAAEGAEADNAD
jgi:hypothetical protein